MLPVFLLKFLIPSMLGYIVIGDKGPLDFLVWVSVTTRDSRFVQGFIGRFTLALASKSYLNIYVRAELEVLKARKPNVTHSLFPRFAIYDFLAKKVKVPIIDTTKKTVEESVKEICSILSKVGIKP
ncbi:MAG: hypothetical protein QXL22_04090 [Candidatus Nezhaarchaeales archaeon]